MAKRRGSRSRRSAMRKGQVFKFADPAVKKGKQRKLRKDSQDVCIKSSKVIRSNVSC